MLALTIARAAGDPQPELFVFHVNYPGSNVLRPSGEGTRFSYGPASWIRD